MARQSEMVKPEGITSEAWLSRLTIERNDVLRQLRREAHTRGNTVQSYLDRIDRAIAKAMRPGK